MRLASRSGAFLIKFGYICVKITPVAIRKSGFVRHEAGLHDLRIGRAFRLPRPQRGRTGMRLRRWAGETPTLRDAVPGSWPQFTSRFWKCSLHMKADFSEDGRANLL